MRKRSVKDPPWQKRIRNVIGCLAAAVVMMASMTGQAWAATYTYDSARQTPNPLNLKCGDVLKTGSNTNNYYGFVYGPGAGVYRNGKKLTSEYGSMSYAISTSGTAVDVTNGAAVKQAMSGEISFYMENKRSGKMSGATVRQLNVSHNWGGAYNTANPTCTSNGTARHDCQSGDGYETWTVNALGHSWTGWESDGNNHWKRCTRCGARTSQGAHNWGSYYGDTATCTAGGTKKHKCNTCGKEVTVSSSALGHVWPSTYTQDGGYLYKYCTRCKAQLEKKPISYSIKFNGNGATSGSMIGQGFAYGTAQNLFENAFVRQNYEFIGWANDENATTPIYKDQQSVNNLTTTNNATINLYAVWKLSTTTITFHDQSGTGGPGEVVWLIGSTQSPTAPKREGYNFSGWNTAEDGSGAAWPKDNIVPANITDYYAQWIPNMYTTVQEQNQKQ